MSNGTSCTYFHGVPGSARELDLFGFASSLDWHVPDRNLPNAGITPDEHFDALAAQLESEFSGSAIRLAGFSIGAYVALEVARRLPHLSIQIDLVSAAAPLGLVDCLDQMAGKTVFRLARYHSLAFRMLTAAQSIAARITPQRLCDALFASARDGDRDLCGDPHFRAGMEIIVRECFAGGTAPYRREILGYVSDWESTLREVHHPVTIWHGASDNWAPPDMALALAHALPNVASVHIQPGLSHYSTLRAYQQNAAHHARKLVD